MAGRIRENGKCFDAGKYAINGVTGGTWERHIVNFTSAPVVVATMNANEAFGGGHDDCRSAMVHAVDQNRFEYDFYASGTYSANAINWMAWGQC